MVAAAILLVGAPAAAHPIVDPLPVELFLLEDEQNDAFLVIDGYDLYELHVRETHWPEHGDGITFRTITLGGFGPGSLAEEMALEIGIDTPSGPWSARIATNDDQEWTTDAGTLIEVDVRPDIYGWETWIQLFVSYSELGVEVGDGLSGVWMRSLVDDGVVDVAPGGFYLVPGSPVLVPSDSERVTDEFELKGPVGYLEAQVDSTADGFHLEVQNLFPDDGQHVRIELEDSDGWLHDQEQDRMVNLDPDARTELSVEVLATGEGPLLIQIWSDMGGLETWFVHATREGLVASQDPSVPEGDDPLEAEEAPAAWLGVLLIVASVCVARRRRMR